MSRGAAAVLCGLAAAVAAAGCGEPVRPPGAGGGGASGKTPEQAAAAAGVPADCALSVPVDARPMPPDFPVPEGKVIAGPAQPSGELLQVTGFVTRSPTQAARDLLRPAGVTKIAYEDEGVDAEVTFSNGRHRVLYKLVRACAAGSRFVALRAPEPGS